MNYLTKTISIIILMVLFAVIGSSNDNDVEADTAEIVTEEQESTVASVDPEEKTNRSIEEPKSVMAGTIRPFGEAGGYTYAEARMLDTAEREDGSAGKYEVPMIFIYPNDGGYTCYIV